MQPKPIEIYICEREWRGRRMLWNEAWSWNAVVKAAVGGRAINWLQSSNLKKGPETFKCQIMWHLSFLFFLLSLVFHLIDWNFSYLCHQLCKLGWLKAFLFFSTLAWQTAYATAYTFNNTNKTASELKKPLSFLSIKAWENLLHGMWQEAIYKELTLTVTLCSWFSKI